MKISRGLKNTSIDQQADGYNFFKTHFGLISEHHSVYLTLRIYSVIDDLSKCNNVINF